MLDNLNIFEQLFAITVIYGAFFGAVVGIVFYGIFRLFCKLVYKLFNWWLDRSDPIDDIKKKGKK